MIRVCLLRANTNQLLNETRPCLLPFLSKFSAKVSVVWHFGINRENGWIITPANHSSVMFVSLNIQEIEGLGSSSRQQVYAHPFERAD